MARLKLGTMGGRLQACVCTQTLLPKAMHTKMHMAKEPMKTSFHSVFFVRLASTNALRTAYTSHLFFQWMFFFSRTHHGGKQLGMEVCAKLKSF